MPCCDRSSSQVYTCRRPLRRHPCSCFGSALYQQVLERDRIEVLHLMCNHQNVSNAINVYAHDADLKYTRTELSSVTFIDDAG